MKSTSILSRLIQKYENRKLEQFIPNRPSTEDPKITNNIDKYLNTLINIQTKIVSDNKIIPSYPFMERFNVDETILKQFNDEDKNTCVICTETILLNDTCYKLKCKHIFHCKCLTDWFENKKCCPICKENIPIN